MPAEAKAKAHGPGVFHSQSNSSLAKLKKFLLIPLVLFGFPNSSFGRGGAAIQTFAFWLWIASLPMVARNDGRNTPPPAAESFIFCVLWRFYVEGHKKE
ncbi:MAG: hypothetical protein H6853_08415 [Rhodospirillales bacterium]|nr:hypothetical protein [Alphaproteobacteria bacterium]USO03534.1 MAG: hypothetical protein H6853_08415 [Rhodospirillales bacterium]